MKPHRFTHCLIKSPYKSLWLLLLFALILHSSGLIKGSFHADDYVHAAMFTDAQDLKRLGVLEGINNKNVWSLAQNQFNFFDPVSANYQALRDYGILPWWTDEKAKIHFFRPLATLTHWLDYQWFPKNPYWMHSVSLFWYLLSLLAVFAFCRQFGLTQGQSLFALLLVTLDVSSIHTVGWIAARNSLIVIALGLFSLTAFNKSTENKRWYIPSLLLFIACLLSAEASITICLFFAAFTLSLDPRPMLSRLLAVLPFAIITLVWRLYYSSQSFGVSNVDFYTDPVNLVLSSLNHPFETLSQSFLLYNQRFFELVTGLEALTGQLNPEYRWITQLLGGLFLGIFLWLIFQNKESKPVRFFAMATLLGVLPTLLSTSPMRGLLLPFISFSAVFVLIASNKTNKGLLKKLSVITVLLFSVGFALIINLWLFFIQMQPKAETSQFPSISPNKNLVIINGHRLFKLTYWPFEQSYYGRPLPKSFHILSLDFYDARLTRISENQLLVTKSPHFQLDNSPIKQANTAGHYLFAENMLLGLFRTAQHPIGARNYSIDNKWINNKTIHFIQMNEDQPKALLFDLPNSETHWVIWDNKNTKYTHFSLPETGDSCLIKGSFESTNHFERTSHKGDPDPCLAN